MSDWKEYKLEEITKRVKVGYVGSCEHAYCEFSDNAVPMIRTTNLSSYGLDYSNLKYVTREFHDSNVKSQLHYGDILIARHGDNGKASIYNSHEEANCLNVVVIEADENKVPSLFIKYLFDSPYIKNQIQSSVVGSVQNVVNTKTIANLVVNIPDRVTQDRIVSVLNTLDKKIECNRRINENLEQQAQALFKSWFVDFEPFKDQPFVESELGMIPQKWRVQEAQEVFSINIGKTPPRKESEWFTVSSEDNVWVSIADMGSCGTFISDSSEYLTDEAVKRFNIQMVEKDSILLSFKLTVGRVAIADTRLTTNEAIARFILPEKSYREFLYLYLKQYKYGNLGSTSSIATAVNSKTIKGMKLLIPNAEVIERFNENTRPLFEQIRTIQQESRRLAELRDALLPKLMSGELKVENVTF